MRASKLIILAILLLFGACTTISQKSRIEQFETLSKNYERALSMSDFNTAFQFLDPAIRRDSLNDRRFSKVRVVQHLAKNIQISPDVSEISQDVELQYYLLDHNVLQSSNFKEIWRYSETRKIWLLETPLPIF